jgi:hypothetical protein
MKVTLAMVVALSVFVPIVTAGTARADADDDAWIRRCVSDNKEEGQSVPVVLAYCTCMNNRMSSSETRSVTAFERANPQIQEACSREAGWKGK